jgi:hypothetical protein
MSNRAFEDVNKDYALAAAQLGEIELKMDEHRDALTDLANAKVKIKKQVNKLREEAKAIQGKPQQVNPSELVPSELKPEDSSEATDQATASSISE